MDSQTQSIGWLSTKNELNVCRTTNGGIDYDKYRKSSLEEIEKYTKIPVIVYATDFLNAQKVKMSQGQVDIDLSDLQGFVEITKDLPAGPLDVILHSPGGSPEAAESIVKVLREKFNPIRFIIPVCAKSAATMIALSGNEILMPKSAELGPTDPQFRLSDGAGGVVMVPAQALIDQFKQAQTEITSDQKLATSWVPILQRYGVGLLQISTNAIELSKNLVQKWLVDYMFIGQSDAERKARIIVDYLTDHNQFKSHGRRVDLKDLQDKGINAKDIISHDAVLWTKIEKAWYAIQHTFEGTGTFKLFENSRNKSFIRIMQIVTQQINLPQN